MWSKKEALSFTKKNLYMIDNCRVVEEDPSGITVEIDLFEH